MCIAGVFNIFLTVKLNLPRAEVVREASCRGAELGVSFDWRGEEPVRGLGEVLPFCASAISSVK